MIEYEYITDDSNISSWCDCICSAPLIGVDIETTSLIPFEGEIRLVQLKLDTKIVIFDFFKLSEGSKLKLATSIATSSGIKIGHGLKFEQKWFLYCFGLDIWPIFDTHRASELIYNGEYRIKQDLWSLFERELGISHVSEDYQVSKWGQGELSSGQLEYAAEDVLHLYELRNALRTKLITLGLVKTAMIEFAVIAPEAAVELNGFMLDKEKWLKILEENITKREALSKELLKELPPPYGQLPIFADFPCWDLDSPKQMLSSLNWLIGTKDLKDTNNTSLVMVADNYPLIHKVIDYREIAKRCTSYSMTYVDAIHSRTNRIHCNFWPFLVSGRYGIKSPNLGQIPREGIYRECFIADTNNKLVIGDWKNIEMCIIAELSRDQELLRIFAEGKDAHYETAAELNNKTVDKVTKKERQEAKPLNFGFGYGMGAAKLVLYAKAGYGVDLNIRDAYIFRKKWFKKYRGVGTWHDRVLREGKRTRLSRTMSGRLRFMSEDAHSEYLNNPVQGTGADMLKTALRYVYDNLKRVMGVSPVRVRNGTRDYLPSILMVNHVHDELVLEASYGSEDLASSLLKDGMKRAGEVFLRQVPTVVDGGVGQTWASK